MSVTFLRYSQASCTLFLRNASSISWSIFLVIMRMRILECSLMKPRPIGYPSKSRTSTMSPFSYAPKIEAISLSKIQAPPCFKARPSPFFSVTTALLKSFSSLVKFVSVHLRHSQNRAYSVFYCCAAPFCPSLGAPSVCSDGQIPLPSNSGMKLSSATGPSCKKALVTPRENV